MFGKAAYLVNQPTTSWRRCLMSFQLFNRALTTDGQRKQAPKVIGEDLAAELCQIITIQADSSPPARRWLLGGTVT